jgi:hypothetical protein
MLVTHLGHQTMLLEHDDTEILLDPLLLQSFGEGYSPSPMRMFPPRSIDSERFTNLAAVFISHEHFDHFNVASLNLLPRQTPIFVGQNMLDAVVTTISELGFAVTRAPFQQELNFGGISVSLWPPAPTTVQWEKRVSQVIATDTSGASLVIAIDAELGSEIMAEAVQRHTTAVCLSNNAQTTPPGVMGALTNYRQTATESPSAVGLDIITALLQAVDAEPSLQKLPILITGGGFVKDYEEMGPFPFSQQEEVAAAACALLGRDDIYGPVPGEVFRIDSNGVDRIGTADWVKLDTVLYDAMQQQLIEFLRSGQEIERKALLAPRPGDVSQLQRILDDLADMQQLLLLSPLGARLIDSCSKGKAQDFAVCITDESTGMRYTYAFDVVASAFKSVAGAETDTELAASYNYGFSVSLSDLLAVLDGRLQIWDLAGVAINSWYEGPRVEGPMPVLYSWYGEQGAPVLATQLYTTELTLLSKEA